MFSCVQEKSNGRNGRDAACEGSRASAHAEADRLSDEEEEEEGEDEDGGPSGLSRSRSINRQRLVAHSTAMESIQADAADPIDEEDHIP